MRELETTSRFTDGIASMRGVYPRIDFAIEAIRPSLVNKPESFPEIIGRPISVAKLLAFDGIPDATIYFRYDERSVMLLRIELN